MKISIFVLFCLQLFINSCSQSTEPDTPDWVNNLVAEFKSQPVGNPPQSIWQYMYKDKIVYYIPPQCCDQFSALYDESGLLICAPDGGFSGTGDGKCTDFFNERINEKLIWKDTRTR